MNPPNTSMLDPNITAEWWYRGAGGAPLVTALKNWDIEDITCLHVDMNFIFECSTRYLTSECSEWVRYRVEHKKIKFISTSGHVIFCLLCKLTNHDVFYDFPKISDHFPKISEDFPKLFQWLDERFRTFSEDCWRFPKVAKDFRGGTDDVSIIQQYIWVLF